MKGQAKAQGLSRKQAVIAAAVELFASQGFQATSTAELAKKAGVSEGIIFYYFKSKQGILLELLESVFADYLARLERAVGGAPSGLDAVEAYIRAHFAMVRERSQLVTLLVRDFPAGLTAGKGPSRQRMKRHLAAATGHLAQSLRRGQADGSIGPCPVDDTAQILRGLLIGATRLELLGLGRMSDPAGQAAAFCRRALAAAGEPDRAGSGR